MDHAPRIKCKRCKAEGEGLIEARSSYAEHPKKKYGLRASLIYFESKEVATVNFSTEALIL